MGRATSKDAEHSRSVSIFLGDGNSQDVFAVKISQDAVYGTPIFTTMGGRSSCVGETGTTRRDSRVIIKEIKPLCNVEDSISTDCPSSLVCECEKLAPGKDAIFSVVLENLSPWVTAVIGRRLLFDAAKEDKPLSLDAMIHALAICSLPPTSPKTPGRN